MTSFSSSKTFGSPSVIHRISPTSSAWAPRSSKSMFNIFSYHPSLLSTYTLLFSQFVEGTLPFFWFSSIFSSMKTLCLLVAAYWRSIHTSRFCLSTTSSMKSSQIAHHHHPPQIIHYSFLHYKLLCNFWLLLSQSPQSIHVTGDLVRNVNSLAWSTELESVGWNPGLVLTSLPDNCETG